MLDHRMIGGERQRARDHRDNRQGEGADGPAGRTFHQIEPIEPGHEIVMPIGAPELPVGDDGQAEFFLEPDRLDDFSVLGLLEVGGCFALAEPGQRSLFKQLLPCPLDPFRPKQAAHMIGPRPDFPVRHVVCPPVIRGI